MAKNILIVESPAKANTINKYLGSDFEVLASYGHVRDLVPREGAVDPDHGFEMNYQVIDRNRKHVDKLVKAARKAEAVYLATDLDREGEAIAWHVQRILEEAGALKDRPLYRVVFSEITKRAVQEAVANPREISKDLVDAQQARRALDYLVGFNLSPLLWRKVQPGLSAGRVQSPALRMIVEREEEIERFEPQEYWTIEADLNKDSTDFTAALVRWQDNKLEQFDIDNADQAHGVRQRLLEGAQGRMQVARVKKQQRKRRPAPPFITSTLQQEASRKLRFSASRTMRLAQQLYEGVQVEGGNQGLITYMRTDSVNLASEAIQDMRKVIDGQFGSDKLPEKPNFYSTKSRNAQEAHEAIRPTSAELTPDRVKPYLSEDQLKLYTLIWKRALASQMKHALMDTVRVEFDGANDSVLRANGSTIRDPGFLSVYEESAGGAKSKKKEVRLPALEEGDVVDLRDIRAEQHFTEPPPRYSEASLVKTLEDCGIGRPSTYAAIISTLLDREYVELDRRRFVPTDTGRVVAKFLSNHFERYVDYDFTARLEDELDAISRGEKDSVPVLEHFWEPFKERVEEKAETVSRDEARQTRVLGEDPESGETVRVRLGRYGPYAQLGDGGDDNAKPRFAGLRNGQRLETITLEEALKLFQLPRELGETPEGEPVSANIGPYGPYVRFANKFVSLQEGDDPYTIGIDRALELVAEKKKADANRIIHEFDADGLRILRGRFGPYVTDGNKNASVPKDRDPETLTLEECRELIANAPERRRGRKKSGKKKAGAASKKAAAKAGGKKGARKASKKAAKKGAKKAGKKSAGKTAKKTGKKAGKKKGGKKKAGKKAGRREDTARAGTAAAGGRKGDSKAASGG